MVTPHPVLLAIDSSTETLCLAACAGERTALWHGVGGAQASAILLTQARALLEQLGVSFGELDAVGFACGPGAFTGLRTACAAAQGLALGAGCGVLSIDSLMIVAQAAVMGVSDGLAPADARDIGIVMDARMGELYAARYTLTGSVRSAAWRVLEPPWLATAAVVAERWLPQPPQGMAGSGAELLAAATGGGQLGHLACSVTDAQRTAALLVLSQAAWREGRLLAPEAALPLYVRDKVAQTTAERAASAIVAQAAVPFGGEAARPESDS